jgi:hypothetical protein
MKNTEFVLIFLFFLFLNCGLVAQKPVNAEDLVISTDREVYVSGERLFFTVHLLSPSGKISDFAYLTLNNPEGFPVFNGCMKMKGNQSFGTVFLPDTLVSGIYQLVSFTNCMRNSGSSSFARKNIIITNRFDNSFNDIFALRITDAGGSPTELISEKDIDSGPRILTDKRVYNQREKVKITLNVPENIINGLVSLSVREAAPFSFEHQETSGLKTVAGDQCAYLPEKKGMMLQGRLTDEYRKASPGTIVFLSAVDTAANLQYTTTNQDGTFHFFLNPYYFGRTLSIKSIKDFNGFIETDNKFIIEKPLTQTGLRITGDLVKYLQNSQKYQTIHHSYPADYVKEKKNPETGLGYRPSVYEKQGDVVYPSDFVYLPDFMEISREILPFMKTRFKNREYVAYVLDIDQNIFSDVFIFVDGVLIEDVNQIMYFDSKRIKKTETLPNSRQLGELQIPNVVSINTVNDEISKLQWKKPVKVVQADSVMNLAYYSPPPPGSVSGNIPDFRQLLFWEPQLSQIKTNTVLLETYTSDCTGEFEIVLTYRDLNGKMTESRKLFNVIHP